MAVYKGAGIWNQVFTLVLQALNHILSPQTILFFFKDGSKYQLGCEA